jgi:hypothetical protein
LHGTFLWARRALNSHKRRFPALAEDDEISIEEFLDLIHKYEGVLT